MSSMYDTNRENFEKLLKKYQDYLQLYATFNNGSIEGATPFQVFYWRFTYHIRYEDPQRVMVLRT